MTSLTTNSFHVVDYVVLVGMLAVSLGIGAYYALAGGKQRTREEYLLGNRKLGTFPVFVSVLVSFMSSVSILGIPAEVNQYGIQFGLSE